MLPGPSTKTVILNKATGAGEAYFQSVGNTLYWGRSLISKSGFSLLKFGNQQRNMCGDFIIDPMKYSSCYRNIPSRYNFGYYQHPRNSYTSYFCLCWNARRLLFSSRFFCSCFLGLSYATFLNGQNLNISPFVFAAGHTNGSFEYSLSSEYHISERNWDLQSTSHSPTSTSGSYSTVLEYRTWITNFRWFFGFWCCLDKQRSAIQNWVYLLLLKPLLFPRRQLLVLILPGLLLLSIQLLMCYTLLK